MKREAVRLSRAGAHRLLFEWNGLLFTHDRLFSPSALDAVRPLFRRTDLDQLPLGLLSVRPFVFSLCSHGAACASAWPPHGDGVNSYDCIAFEILVFPFLRHRA